MLQPTITPLRWCPSNRSRPFLSKNLGTIKNWKCSQSIFDSQARPIFFPHLANPWRTPSLKNPSSFSPSVNATFALPSNLITILISSFLVLSNVWSAHKHCGPVPPVVALHPSYPSTWRRRHPAPEKNPYCDVHLNSVAGQNLAQGTNNQPTSPFENWIKFYLPSRPPSWKSPQTLVGQNIETIKQLFSVTDLAPFHL